MDGWGVVARSMYNKQPPTHHIHWFFFTIFHYYFSCLLFNKVIIFNFNLSLKLMLHLWRMKRVVSISQDERKMFDGSEVATALHWFKFLLRKPRYLIKYFIFHILTVVYWLFTFDGCRRIRFHFECCENKFNSSQFTSWVSPQWVS